MPLDDDVNTKPAMVRRPCLRRTLVVRARWSTMSPRCDIPMLKIFLGITKPSVPKLNARRVNGNDEGVLN